jgi:hypothetical protein
MTSKRVELTHPKIPGSRFSAFAQQVELWAARGWEVATDAKQESAAPAKKPAVKKPAAQPEPTTPAAAPTDTRKES